MKAHRMIVDALDGKAMTLGTLTLSMPPPSLNHAFINAGKAGRIKSPIYRGWQTMAHLELRRQSGWHVPGRIKVYLHFNRAETRADLDNLIKPVLDLLVAAGRIADDRNVVHVEASFDNDAPGTLIVLTAHDYVKIPVARAA